MDRNELMKLYEELMDKYGYILTDGEGFTIATTHRGHEKALEFPESLGEESKIVALVHMEVPDICSFEDAVLHLKRTIDYCDHYLRGKGYEHGVFAIEDGFLEVRYEVSVRTQDDLEKVVRDFSS